MAMADRTWIHYETQHPMENARVYERMVQVPEVRFWLADIMAFIPVYSQGNGCLVATRDEELLYLPCRTYWLRKKLMGHFAINEQSLRRACEEEVGTSLYTPLILPGQDSILAPMKVRTPLTRNDGAIGYFRLQNVTGKVPTSDTTINLLMGDTLAFHIEMSMKNVHKRIMNARITEAVMARRGRPYTY